MASFKYFLSIPLGILLIVVLVMMTNEPQRFQKYQRLFLDQYFRDHPVTATWIGIHEYDGDLPRYDPESVRRQQARLVEYKRIFSSLRRHELSPDDQIDLDLLLNAVDQELFEWDDMQSYTWNPLTYLYPLGYGLESLADYDFAPADTRGEALLSRLEETPAYLQTAEDNLGAMPRPHLETAIRQCTGIEHLVTSGLDSFLTGVSPELAGKIRSQIPRTAAALTEFRSFLQTREAAGPYRDFRIGPRLYEEKLRYVINEHLNPEEILQRAELALAEIQHEMLDLAVPLYRDMTGREPAITSHAEELQVIRAVLDTIASSHAHRSEVVSAARATLQELQEFIESHHLLALDPTKPLIIRETPEYQRGVSMASLQAPGPLENNLQTYYNVSPIPEDWSDEQAESYLREYNTIAVKILSIHEALPGHYVQLIYANRNPSLVRAVFSSGDMVEGWAHYAETMMIDAGFGGGDPRYKLVELKWKLRGIANAIMDQKIHAEEMTRDEALDLMIKETFQERSEAEAKWKRAQLTSVQLSTYFVGYSLMMDLRRDVEEAEGSAFDLGSFHERLLSHGSIPIRYLRQFLLP